MYQLVSLLEDALRHWDSYHHLMTKVSQDLTETDYTLRQHQVTTGDVELFAEQLEHLKVKSITPEIVQVDSSKLTLS